MKPLSEAKQAMRSRMQLRRDALYWNKNQGLQAPSTPAATAIMVSKYKHYLKSLDPAKDKEPADINVLIRQRNDQVSKNKKIKFAPL